MSGSRAADAAFYALLLILPLSALVARRPPLRQTLKYAAAWVGIFAVGLLLVSQRERLSGMTSLLSDQKISGGETRIAMAEDGHFWAEADINGTKRRMLIDSGATTTAISQGTAEAAGLNLDESPFSTMLNTANGEITARTSTAKTLMVGSVTVRDLGVVVSPAFGDTDVIGMNFLSRLAAWRVEGRTLCSHPQSSETYIMYIIDFEYRAVAEGPCP